MKDLKGYEDVVNQMTAKLAHACDVIKTKLTQESSKPIKDFEVSCEGMTKAIITFYDEWFSFGETTDIQYFYKVLEEAVSSDPENLRYCLEKDYSCGGLVKIELQDYSKYLGNYEIKVEEKDESYEKNKYLCNLLEENIKYHNRMVAMRTVLDKHNLMGEVEELLKEIGLK
jgi:hypothetical protein